MTDEYYSAPDTAPASDSGGAKPSKPQVEDAGDEMEGDTALVPKSVFRGKIPDVGQDCTFHVEHIWEDEVELSWKKDEGESNPASSKRSAMDTATDSFDKMASPSAAEE
jgi:hypothetical protein